MELLRRWRVLTGALVLGLAASAFGADVAQNGPTTQPAGQQDLQAQVNDLKAQVAKLQTNQQQNQADVSAAIQQVLADADQRSKLLDGGMGVTAGYAERRFFIASTDGNFLLKPWIHMQIRNSTAWRENQKNGGDDTQNGFELRRARFGFDGNFFSKDLTYFINWATFRGNGTLTVKNGPAVVGTTNSPVGGLPVLEEAWLKYHFADTPFFLHVGQMHDPLDHENIVGSKYRAPEASLQGDIFGNTDTFTQGATLIYDNKGPIRFEGGITDGIRAANTNFQDFPNNGILYDGGVAGRVEYKVMGNWKDYDQLTALNDKKDLLVLGSGVDYSYGGNYDSISHTLDAQYANPAGWFAYLCYFGRYTENNPGIPLGAPVSTSFGGTPADLGQDTYEYSMLGQVAYLIDNKLEPYARYEYLHLAGTPAGSQNNVTEISVGANYYFYGHNVKLTGQVMYLPTGIPINDDSSDVLISNRKGEVVFITQIQLLL
ncbi:MAG: porin [Planctomycetota bacterium]|nr:porin [Planctomycetota bacterium]